MPNIADPMTGMLIDDPATGQPAVEINTPAKNIVASQAQLAELKPFDWEDGDTQINPYEANSPGGQVVQRETSTSRVNIDTDALGQNLKEGTEQAGQQLREAADKQQTNIFKQVLRTDTDRRVIEDEAAQKQKEYDANAQYIAKLEATKIDESDWWRDGGTGRTVAATLALAAGGFLNGIQPGSSNVSEVIHGAIERYARNKMSEKRDELTRRTQLLGSQEQAIKALKIDARKAVLDTGALMMQSGQVDVEFAKTMAGLYHQNVKDMNGLLMAAAPRETVQEKTVNQPAQTIPWQRYGMTQQRVDRFTQGDGKEPGAYNLLSQAESARSTLADLKKLARDNKGVLPGYGALDGAIPEDLKTFLARSGFPGVSDMTQARQALNQTILKFISGMNSRLVDSDAERKRMEQIFTENGTPEILGAVESMLERTVQSARDWADQHTVQGVTGKEMLKWVSQTQGQSRSPKGGEEVLREGPPQNGAVGPDGVPNMLRNPPPEPPPASLQRPAGQGYEVTPEDKAAVQSFAEDAGLDAEKMMKVFQKESGGNPRAQNPRSSATGLIQWMQDKYPGGKSREEVVNMTFEEQAYAATHYFLKHGLNSESPLVDYYAAVAAPGILKKYGSFDKAPQDEIVYKAGSKAAEDNPAWQDGSGNVTIGSLRAFIGG